KSITYLTLYATRKPAWYCTCCPVGLSSASSTGSSAIRNLDTTPVTFNSFGTADWNISGPPENPWLLMASTHRTLVSLSVSNAESVPFFTNGSGRPYIKGPPSVHILNG